MVGIEAGPVLFRKQLRGKGLVAARVGWLLVVVSSVALSVFGFVAGFADLTLLGPESIFVALGEANIDLATSAVVALVLPLVLMTVIGAVMFWKRSADPLALLTSLMLTTLMAAFSRSPFAAVSTVPELSGIVHAVFFVGFGSAVGVGSGNGGETSRARRERSGAGPCPGSSRTQAALWALSPTGRGL